MLRPLPPSLLLRRNNLFHFTFMSSAAGAGKDVIALVDGFVVLVFEDV